MPPAILLAAHGTRIQGAQDVYRRFAERVVLRHPGASVSWAYSSQTIRHKLNAEGMFARSVRQALEELAATGHQTMAVQSLHVIPGEDVDETRRAAEDFSREHPGIRLGVGEPLLASEADVQAVAAAILNGNLGRHEPDEALVLVGHGSSGPGQARWAELEQALRRRDQGVFVGALDAWPGPAALVERLDAAGWRRVRIVPFMCAAGYHAREDVAGPGEESWASLLSEAGLEVRGEAIGLGDDPDVADVWLSHLDQALASMG